MPSSRWFGSTAKEVNQRVGGNALHLSINDHALTLFHFARFRPLAGDWWWQSGQLDYGVMPWTWRQKIYGPYVRALLAARDEIAARRLGFDFLRPPGRPGREFWSALPFRIVFGGDWLWLGGRLGNGRVGLGRWSGQCRAKLRTIFLRT